MRRRKKKKEKRVRVVGGIDFSDFVESDGSKLYHSKAPSTTFDTSPLTYGSGQN